MLTSHPHPTRGPSWRPQTLASRIGKDSAGDTPCCPPRGSPWRCCFDIRGPLPWAGGEGFGRRMGRVTFGRWQEQVWKPLTPGEALLPIGLGRS